MKQWQKNLSSVHGKFGVKGLRILLSHVALDEMARCLTMYHESKDLKGRSHGLFQDAVHHL
jgi:hypothetical protein